MTPRCLAPWTHMFHHSDGNIYPCCRFPGNKEFVVGTVKEPIQQVWNSEKMKKMRLDLLSNNLTPICAECVSTPVNFNHVYEMWRDDIDVNKTAIDGEFEFTYKTWNVVTSNICNQRCVYCANDYSNLITDVFGQNAVKSCFPDLESFKSYFEPLLESIGCFYFAGGESTIQESMLWLITRLIELQLLDKRIYFFTNLSALTYKNYDIGQMLSQFKNATVVASIDGLRSVNALVRKGTDWNKVMANRRELLKYPNLKFGVSAVITNINIGYVPDFHREWYDQGLLTISGMRYTMLSTPKQYSILNIGEEAKRASLKTTRVTINF